MKPGPPKGKPRLFAPSKRWVREQYIKKRRRNADICAELGCSPPTLLRILKNFDITPRDDRVCAVHPSRRRRFDLDEATRLYFAPQMPCNDIGKRFGISGDTVRRRLRETGVKIRHHNDTKRGRPSHRRIVIDPADIINAYCKTGTTIRSLCAQFSVTQGVIRRIVGSLTKFKPRNRNGKNNPNWKGRISPEERAARRNSAATIKWRLRVFRRDGFACKRCGDDRGKNLNAHHIQAHCENIEARYKLSNGITLCVGCHREFHRRFGFRGFGRNDLLRHLVSTPQESEHNDRLRRGGNRIRTS